MARKIKKDKMLRKLVFATNNKNKIKEVSEIVGHKFDIVCLDELGCHDDIAETGTTLEENALIKARYINQKYGRAEWRAWCSLRTLRGRGQELRGEHRQAAG